METVVGLGYVRTFPGILKLLELFFNLVGLIIVVASGLSARGQAFVAASAGGLIITFFLLLCYVANLIGKIHIPWFKIEFFYCVIWVIFYIIVSALCIATVWGPYIAGGVFGLLATITYGVDAYHKFTNGG